MVFLKRCILLIATIVALLALVPSVAYGETKSEFIIDETGLLDVSTLEHYVNSLEEPSDVRFVFILSNNKSLTEDNYDDDIRSYATTVLPEEVMKDKDSLGNDVVLIVISPTIRKMGVYAGDGIAINESATNKIVNSMTNAAKNGDWTQAFMDGSNEGNTLLNPRLATESKDRKTQVDEPIFIPYWVLGVLGAGVLALAIGLPTRAILRRKERLRLLDGYTLVSVLDARSVLSQAQEADSLLRMQGIKSSLESDYRGEGLGLHNVGHYLDDPSKFNKGYRDANGVSLRHLMSINDAVETMPNKIEDALIKGKLLPAWEQNWEDTYSDMQQALESARDVADLDPDKEIDVWLKNVDKQEQALKDIDKKVRKVPDFTLTQAESECKEIIATLKADGKTFAKRYQDNNPYFKPTRQRTSIHGDSLMPMLFLYAMMVNNNTSSSQSSSYSSNSTSSVSTSFSSFSGGGFSGGSGSF